MLPLLLLLITAQVPAVPGETSLVSSCKQGLLSACAALKEINPTKAAEVMRGLEVLKAAEEVAEQPVAEDDEAASAAEEAAPEPPDCKGQNHHIISRPIAKVLARHKKLGGLFKPRDKRFVTRAKDEESHCGYQEWHRDVDQEVIAWLNKHPEATPEQFLKFLREIYSRPKMVERFPNGF
jgi:hypothetical protein